MATGSSGLDVAAGTPDDVFVTSRLSSPPPLAGWIVLNGLRGSGKSTLARRLADRRGVAAEDLDLRVRRRFGDRSVAEIWRTDGEAAFRAAEARVLAEVLTEAPGVLALGGGTAMVPAAADRLRQAVAAEGARIVYLRASAPRLAARLRADEAAGAAAAADRPPLRGEAAGPGRTTSDPLAESRWAFEQRDAAYRAMASVVLELDAILGGDPAVEPADGPERLMAALEAAVGPAAGVREGGGA